MRTVLIVNHDYRIVEEVRDSIRKWIQKKQHPAAEIYTVHSVQEALGILSSHTEIDLLIVDSELPVLNGLRLIRHFQERIEMRKILMTVDPLIVSRLIDYAREGVDAVLPKPVTEEMLGKILEHLLH
jgi:CheY-like chemotaxis protein